MEHPILEELSANNLLGTAGAPMLDIATWSDTMDEYVGKLLAHLSRHKEQFRRPRQVEYSPSGPRFSIQSDYISEPSGGARVLSVDPEVVSAWSARFAGLMHAVEQKDTDQARKLLSSTDLHERSGENS